MYAQGIREEPNQDSVPIWDKQVGDLYSKRDWIMAAHWLEAYMREHPGIRFYNTCDTGLTLVGAERVSIQTLLEEELLKQYDIKGFLHQLWQISERKKIDPLKRSLLLETVCNSLLISKEICDKLLGLFEQNYPDDPREKGEFVVYLYDLYDEIAYQKLLEPLWKVWRFPIERELSSPYEKEIHRLLFFKKIIQSHL